MNYPEAFFSDPDATVFQHPAFLEALPKIAGRGRVELIGHPEAPTPVFVKGFPVKRGYSLPYGCSGGPVGNPSAFFKSLKTLRKEGFWRLEIVDLRNRLPAEGFAAREEMEFVFPLPQDPDAVPERMWEMRRRELRKFPYEIREDGDPELAWLLHRETYRRAGVWFVPEEGFLEIVKKKEIARLYTAHDDGRMVGCLLVLAWGRDAHWWVNGWDAGYRGVMTNLLAYAMRQAVLEGRETFHLGATETEGVALFKRSLGGVPYRYKILNLEKGLYRVLRRLKEKLF